VSWPPWPPRGSARDDECDRDREEGGEDKNIAGALRTETARAAAKKRRDDNDDDDDDAAIAIRREWRERSMFLPLALWSLSFFAQVSICACIRVFVSVCTCWRSSQPLLDDDDDDDNRRLSGRCVACATCLPISVMDPAFLAPRRCPSYGSLSLTLLGKKVKKKMLTLQWVLGSLSSLTDRSPCQYA